MEIKLSGQQSYPSIIDGLSVGGGIDYITQLNMEQIKVICTAYFHKLVELNNYRTDFSEVSEGKIIKTNDQVIEEISKRYKYENLENKEKLSIKKLRILNMLRIMELVLDLYKACKISYKRKGREEAIGKALRGLQEEETIQKNSMPMNSDK